MSRILALLLIAYLPYAQGSPRLIRGSRCNCPNKSLPPCPDFGACAAIICGPGFSCEPCPCNCQIARCVPTSTPDEVLNDLLLDSVGPGCQCRNKTLPPCPDFGACAAITCGPSSSCEPCPCNCKIARCVPTAQLPTPGPRCNCSSKSLPPCPDFGACAAITCGPGFSCEPCPCNCKIARCVSTAQLPTPGSGCNCPNKSLPSCPDFGACAAITCGPGSSCEPCPCNCKIARCVPTAPLPTPGSGCNCLNKSLPPCPDFGACAAITCGPGFSCEPCPCNCKIARCVRTPPLPTPGRRCPCRNKFFRPRPDFGACAAITCGPGFSCEPCRCNCKIARCVRRRPYGNW